MPKSRKADYYCTHTRPTVFTGCVIYHRDYTHNNTKLTISCVRRFAQAADFSFLLTYSITNSANMGSFFILCHMSCAAMYEFVNKSLYNSICSEVDILNTGVNQNIYFLDDYPSPKSAIGVHLNNIYLSKECPPSMCTELLLVFSLLSNKHLGLSPI